LPLLVKSVLPCDRRAGGPASERVAALRAILIYLVVVFGGGALIAARCFWPAQRLTNPWPHLAWLSHVPFHRYVHRSLLVLALVGLWPLVRSLGVRSLRDTLVDTPSR